MLKLNQVQLNADIEYGSMLKLHKIQCWNWIRFSSYDLRFEIGIIDYLGVHVHIIASNSLDDL